MTRIGRLEFGEDEERTGTADDSDDSDLTTMTPTRIEKR